MKKKLLTTFVALALVAAAQAETYTLNILYSFGAGSKDGYTPIAGLVTDATGNLYRTAGAGGGSAASAGNHF